MKSPENYTPNKLDHARSPNLMRRRMLQMAALAPFASLLHAQSATAIAVQKLHTFGLRVSDVERSVAFYQQLFGMPICAQVGDTVCLRIGSGPQFMSLRPLHSGETPGITHIGLSVPDFNAQTVSSQLQAHGFVNDANAANEPDNLRRAMHYWPVNQQAVAFAGKEGLNFQLCAPTYCGSEDGQCSNIAAPNGAGLMALGEINHFTNFMSHAPNTNQFYLNLFGLQYLAYQGPTSPTVSVGDGKQFLMFVGGAQEGAPTRPGRMDHVSMSVEDFAVDAIQAKLESVGIMPRKDDADTPALVHWISLRMPNRGGAEGGTPELYFSDPDSIHIQLQHLNYCGGGGYLGDQCAPLA